MVRGELSRSTPGDPRRKRRRLKVRRKLKKKVVTTPLIVGAKLVKLLYWIVDTGAPGYSIWVNRIRAHINGEVNRFGAELR